MIYGYARVSTLTQGRTGMSLDQQKERLRKAGAEKIFVEEYTGTTLNRPMWLELDSLLTEGDTVIFTTLDRVARSTIGGLELVETLLTRGVVVNILNMGVMDNTPASKLMRTMFLAFAEFERDLIYERTQSAREYKRKTDPNYVDGRPKIHREEFPMVYNRVIENEISINKACEILDIGKSTWYRMVRDHAS